MLAKYSMHNLNQRKRIHVISRNWKKIKKRWKNTGVIGCSPTTLRRITRKLKDFGLKAQPALPESTLLSLSIWMTISCCRASNVCTRMSFKSKKKFKASLTPCAREKRWPF
jgi:hypothetical protein